MFRLVERMTQSSN